MELGTGGMGQVHLAMARGPRGFIKLVVLKTLKAELRGNETTYRMFLEEARISARLAHTNLVQTYEIIEDGDCPTIVFEYVEGQTLASILSQPNQSLSREMYLSILTKVLAGLHAAHELRDFDGSPLELVHRDISPQNVMVQFDGHVKVLDFGIAKTERSRIATEVGILKGKIRYMAPEQLVGSPVDRRVDVFAVGIMLWEALANRRMWGKLDDGEVMRSLLNDHLPPLPASTNVPAELAQICHRAIATDPDRRYQTAGEFNNDLEEYLNRQGSRCSNEQLGAYLSAHFDVERKQTQQVINSHIQSIEESVRPPPVTRSNEATLFAGSSPRISTGEHSKTRKIARPHWRFLTVLTLAFIVAGTFGWRMRHVLLPSVPKTLGGADSTAELNAIRCGPNSKSCGGSCRTLDRPEFGCGNAECRICQTANATPRCNQRNECDIAVCYQAYDNCDGDAKNGCETNVKIDPNHCGGCNHRCPELSHAVRGCGDVCTIWRCEQGFRDCNGVVADGCEVATKDDRNNCGHCGTVCPTNTACREGKCRP